MDFYTANGSKYQLDAEDALRYVGVPIVVASNGYLRINCRGWIGDRYVHRDVLEARDLDHVDHINGDPLDNRKENLRVCTRSQNMCNTKINSNNKSGVKGVYWSKDRLKWCVQISIDNKTIPLGRFDNFEEAVKTRLEAEEKYHGEFARK